MEGAGWELPEGWEMGWSTDYNIPYYTCPAAGITAHATEARSSVALEPRCSTPGPERPVAREDANADARGLRA